MTPKQEERIRTKIKQIKAALAADKKRWGGFHHDGQGLRYLPPRLYLQLGDFSGGLRYLNWFRKYFPDDMGFPDFLFEWTVILFKTGRRKEAEKKAFETFRANTYLFDKFFGRPVVPIEKWEWSNLAQPAFAVSYFSYSCTQENLRDVAAWLEGLTQSGKFAQLMDQFIGLATALLHERDPERRGLLLQQARQLESEL
ncbi:MAG: hypothetical protein NW241_13580 [Bacteroidia bacterium]|nr:hypothetical protein [Bacteroidia bacterium]